jgi:hypothetical protein
MAYNFSVPPDNLGSGYSFAVPFPTKNIFPGGVCSPDFLLDPSIIYSPGAQA